MEPKKNNSILKFFREVVVVLIGVMIALFINSWRETNNNEKFVKSVMTAVQEDINTSQESVKEVYDKHQQLIDTVKFYVDDNNLSIRDLITKCGGVKYPGVKNISLRYLAGSRAELVSYELISTLTEIESSSEFMSLKFEKLLDFTYDAIENSDRTSKIKFLIALSNVVDSEKTLLGLYKDFLQDEKAPSNK